MRAYIAVDSQPELTDAIGRSILGSISQHADTSIGAAWDLDVRSAPTEWSDLILRSLDSLTFEKLPSDDSTDLDKIMLLAVRSLRGEYELQGRDFDVRTRQFGPVVTHAVRQRGLLAVESFRVMAEAFAPLARIEEVDGKKVKLRFKAGALPARQHPAWFQPGDVLRPVIRTLDRDNQTKKIMPVDWTFLSVETVSGAVLACDVHSGMAAALSSRRGGGRVEHLALAVPAATSATRLELRTTDESHRPLAGYEVFSHSAGSTTTELVGITNAEGAVDVRPDGNVLRVLLVKNGGGVLARLPLVPGLERTATAMIPDDDQRLAAEGIVTGLQERFVDLVARRQALIVQIRARIDTGNLDDAQKLLEDLRKLGTQRQFTQIIAQHQRKTVSSDKAVQKKITTLFEDTQQVVNRFLSEREIQEVARLLDEARQPATAQPATASTQ